MDTLRYTSFFAIICFSYVVLIVVLYALGIAGLDPCSDTDCDDTKVEAIPNGDAQDILNLFKSLPIFLCAYTCHANTFAIVNELKDCTPSRINQIIIYTIMFCCVLYCTVGMLYLHIICYIFFFFFFSFLVITITVLFFYFYVGYAGYFTYGKECKSDLLVKYPQDSVSIVIVRISLSIAVAFSYPINVQPCRHCMASLVFNVANADLELQMLNLLR